MNIEKTISRQIAHCCAFYGRDPAEFITQLESIVLEWYIKGKTGFKLPNLQYEEALKTVKEFNI